MTTDVDRLNTELAGRYVVEREIGRGGMATVYLARDERHHRKVAVKVLRDDLAAMIGVERFLREIMISATLEHPNILTLIDSGEADGLLYYVMPFAKGHSLREHIARGLLPVSEAVRYLRDIFDALAYAHSHGVVHRDVKPENIIISGRHALVVDFGVAKAMSAAKELQLANSAETLTQIGTSIGTPAYMAPEQAAGDPKVDHRADLYAAGIVTYEMLAGHPPFTGKPQQVLAAQISATPEPLMTVAPDVPAPLASLVMRCLEKNPANRFSTADDALAALESLSAPAATASAAKRGVSRGTAGAIAAAGVILAVALGFVGVNNRNRDHWAHSVAIPEIQRLIEANAFDSAFTLATRAEEIVGSDSALARLWPRLSAKVLFSTTPANAKVYRTTYDDSLGWKLLRTFATDSVRVPLGITRYRIEADGYHTRHLAMVPALLRQTRLVLDRMDSTDGRMARIAGGETEVAMPGLSRLPVLPLSDFYMDKHEVTNRDYKRFVDAGGYARPEYWEQPIVAGARQLTYGEAMRRFVDRTGRAGPSTWEGGAYPGGHDDLPVTGVSWYEAAAYAKFAGKSLPTLYHWNRAAVPGMGALLIPGSNYGGQGPSRGSTFTGMSAFGTFDMAGNVREWVWNATGDKRFILGGGWSDGAYSFSDAYAQPPMDRSAINGIRLVRTIPGDSLGPTVARAEVRREQRDYSVERPVGDATFEGFRSFFAYDETPFNARIDYRDTTPEFWIRERISFDAPYGGERMAAVLLIPKRHQPPYQAVVVMGGSDLFYTRNDSAIDTRTLDFVVRSGRMVVWPIYKGMLDRSIDLANDSPMETSAYRDLVVALTKDTRRTLDFLATRPDVDTSGIAYFGHSFGGRVSPPIMAMEKRFKAAVLLVAGLKMERSRPEVDPINFLPRVNLPVLMLNGRYDFYFPFETSQKPFFEYLGTRPEHKKWVVYPEAHTVPRTEYMRETLAWLDRYLGEVE